MLLKVKNFIGVASSSLLLFQFFLLGAFAVEPKEVPGVGMEGDLLEWVKDALNLLIGLAGLIAVAILIYSGVMYIISAGDETKVESATKGITYSIIGLVICFISILIVNFVLTAVIGGDTPPA